MGLKLNHVSKMSPSTHAIDCSFKIVLQVIFIGHKKGFDFL